MTVHDRIRLTGLLREGPAPAGPSYRRGGSARRVGAADRRGGSARRIGAADRRGGSARRSAYAARMALLGKLSRREPERVVVDDRGVHRLRGERLVEAVTWEELVEIRVLTTSEGPFAEDVFFVLDAGDHGCVVRQALAPDELLARVQALPAFDNERLIEAMSSTDDAQFVCWRRPRPAG
jgi:hypothetical protein